MIDQAARAIAFPKITIEIQYNDAEHGAYAARATCFLDDEEVAHLIRRASTTIRVVDLEIVEIRQPNVYTAALMHDLAGSILERGLVRDMYLSGEPILPGKWQP